MQAVACGGEAIEAEFRFAVLGDRRREKRLVKLAGALAGEPAASFPRIAGDDEAELEATYRFLGNEAITPEDILAGHYARTVERAAEHGSVIAIHDTSIFEFGGEATRSGLGPLRGNGQGFLGHFSLLVAEGEQRKPLGVSSVQTIIRGEPKRKKRTARQLREDPNKESTRWFAGVRATEQRLGDISVVHVMDREADSYELYAQLQQAGHRFVIRAAHDRQLGSDYEGQALSALLAVTPTVVERLVPLSERRPSKFLKNRRIHPARRARLARLAISGVAVHIERPRHVSAASAPSLAVNVVQVREVETHGEFEPVEWTLVTTEPVATAADLERIVDIYRARWVIEEYFKALKSGCSYEKRQLESSHSLLNALAVFTPIAWRLLLLRTLARDDTEVAADVALTHTQIEVLRATRKKKPLPEQLTARQALLAVAALGGHITNNGEPGWQG